METTLQQEETVVDAIPYKLIVEDDEGKRSVVPVDLGEISIGRQEGSTVRLNERNISRTHCRLASDGETGIYAEDLDSYNGVFVNGDRIQGREPLHQGDLIRVGDFHLELRGAGLTVRAEDTTGRPDLDSTVRTMLPDVDESTHPEIRVDDAKAQRAEPTALIRMDQMPGLAAKGGNATRVAGEKATLLCVSTEYAGREYELERTEISIGRTDDNDVVIDHRSVSSNHARIITSASGHKIVDLDSSNGTLVNGEEYAQVSLKTGDLIELGHVKFRFVAPGAHYDLSGDEAAAMHQGSGAQAMDYDETVMGSTLARNGISPPVVAALGLGLVVALFAVLFIAGGDSEVTEDTAVKTTTVTAQVDSVKLISQAQAYMDQRVWDKAVRLLKLVIGRDPTNENALSMLATCDTESAVKVIYDRANRSIQASQWGDAWNALTDIPETSVYNADAVPLRVQVRSAKVTEDISKFRLEIADRNWVKANLILGLVEGLHPDHPELEGLKEELLAKRVALTPSVAGSSSVRPNRRPRPSAQNPRPSGQNPRSSGQNSRPTEASARTGDRPASKANNPKPGSKPGAKPTVRSPAAQKDNEVVALYKRGVAAVRRGSYAEGARDFVRCNQLDSSYCKCYRSAGIAYAKMGDKKKSDRYYRSYIRICPSARDVAAVRALLNNN